MSTLQQQRYRGIGKRIVNERNKKERKTDRQTEKERKKEKKN